jgi:methionyl-tRNA synthetase
MRILSPSLFKDHKVIIKKILERQIDLKLKTSIENDSNEAYSMLCKHKFSSAIHIIAKMLNDVNEYLQMSEMWRISDIVVKSSCVYYALESMKIITSLLYSFAPSIVKDVSTHCGFINYSSQFQLKFQNPLINKTVILPSDFNAIKKAIIKSK